MARRPSLTEAGVTRPSQALSAPPPPPATPVGRTPARVGKKAIAFWVEPDAARQLRTAAASMDRSIQSIMEEALDRWFQQHGLHRLAATPNGKAA
jgi:hypothetical protein